MKPPEYIGFGKHLIQWVDRESNSVRCCRDFVIQGILGNEMMRVLYMSSLVGANSRPLPNSGKNPLPRH